LQDFWLCFIPLLVAVDAFGTLPLFVNLIEGLERSKIRRIIVQSVFTGLGVALCFLFIGKWVLYYLGITVADFMIAGGILLLLFSISDLLIFEKRQRQLDLESLGAVPLGVPLIVGPAVLTTMILLTNQHGVYLTVLSAVANILLAGIIFWFSGILTRLIGKTGAKIVSKLASLLLAAIAVMMIRKGIVEFL